MSKHRFYHKFRYFSQNHDFTSITDDFGSSSFLIGDNKEKVLGKVDFNPLIAPNIVFLC